MVGAHLLITGVLCFCLQASVHGTPSSLLTVKKMVFHALLNIAPLCVNIQVSHIAFIFFSKFPYASQVPNNKIEVTTGNSICFFMFCFLLLPFMVMTLLMLYMHLQMFLAKVQNVSMWDKLLKRQCFTKICVG